MPKKSNAQFTDAILGENMIFEITVTEEGTQFGISYPDEYKSTVFDLKEEDKQRLRDFINNI